MGRNSSSPIAFLQHSGSPRMSWYSHVLCGSSHHGRKGLFCILLRVLYLNLTHVQWGYSKYVLLLCFPFLFLYPRLQCIVMNSCSFSTYILFATILIPKNIHKSSIIQTEQVLFSNIDEYTYTYIYMHLI